VLFKILPKIQITGDNSLGLPTITHRNASPGFLWGFRSFLNVWLLVWSPEVPSSCEPWKGSLLFGFFFLGPGRR